MSSTLRPSKVTASDVARHAHVSTPAVYQALSGSGRLKESTRQRILKSAAKLGFRLNPAAASTKSGRHQVLGMVISNWNIIPKALLFHLIVEAQRHGFRLLLDVLTDTSDPHILQRDCVDGVLIFEVLPETIRQRLAKLGIPVIEINTNRRTGRGVITYDDEGAVAEALKFLKARGRRRPVLLMPEHGGQHYSEAVRQETFSAVCRELKLRPLPVLRVPGNAGSEPGQTVKTIRQLLGKLQAADALVLYDDRFAAPLLEACRQEGWSLPERAHILTLGESWRSEILYPPISSMAIARETLASTIMETMLDALKSGQPAPAQKLEFQLHERGFTC